VDCWNTGLPDAPERRRYPGPVLVACRSGDGFVTEELVATALSPRFAQAQTVVIDRAGHSPHVEQPAPLAAQHNRFLTAHATPADGNVTADDRPRTTRPRLRTSRPRRSRRRSPTTWCSWPAPSRPIEGRDQVTHVMGTASAMYVAPGRGTTPSKACRNSQAGIRESIMSSCPCSTMRPIFRRDPSSVPAVDRTWRNAGATHVRQQ